MKTEEKKECFMKKFLQCVLFLIAFLFFAQSMAFADSNDCSDEESGSCSVGNECRLDSNQVGICQQSGSDCGCVPVNN